MNRKVSVKNIIVRRKIKLISLLLITAFLAFPLSVSAIPSDNGGASFDIDCKSAILMEAETGSVLYEKDADIALPPASVTKVMTLLLVMEAIEEGKIKYDDMVSASANACSMGGSQIYLEENEQMSVEDLVKSVVIASANDAAVALAEYVSGTEEAFVAQMNQKAQKLGMKNTYFENTNGLDDTVEKHLTSARDIAIMSRELIKYPKITEYSSIWMDSIRNGEFGLTNTNRLVRFYRGATGLKTGSTSKAGFCISATAERDGMTLICVIMGSPSRDVRNAAAVSLLDYGFSNYGVYRAQGDSVEQIPILKGNKPYVKAEYGEYGQVLKKSEQSKVEKIILLPESVEAPVKKGDVIGSVVYKMGDVELGKRDITVSEDIEKLNFSGTVKIFLNKLAEIL